MTTRPSRPPTRRVVIVAYPDIQILDVTGPAEVFATATRFGDPDAAPRYEVELVSPDGGIVTSSGGIALNAHRALADTTGPIDTLVVAGGTGTEQAVRDDELTAWIREAATRSRRITSVCSGAFLLAVAGLLDGRRATTHWSECTTLADWFPAVTVEADRVYVHDGPVWTSAGVTAGMDLALALVEDDHGREAALEVARWLVLFLHRPGGQSQFSAPLRAQLAERPTLRDLQTWIVAHPDADLSVPALAARAHMSTRNFARTFRRELGVTPGDYVESIRMEAARRLLEAGDLGLEAIASACGFGTVETMHRAFKRTVHVTPGQYRRHFRSTPELASATR